MKQQKVLIAHQSTIPHYRIPFFNELERLRPSTLRIEVAFDLRELKTPRVFREPITLDDFKFPILNAPLLTGKTGNTRVSYQRFWRKAASYNLLIVENAINNLTYPLCQLHQIHGVKFAYWGHGRDRSIENPSQIKSIAETIKLWLSRKANGFFAYTQGIKQYLIQKGLSPNKIFVINNTIDIAHQRSIYERFWPERESIRKRLGISDKHVLLFVGRATPNKRLDFLLESFATLNQQSNKYHLVLVGGGSLPAHAASIPGISRLGAITDFNELGPIYTASDLFVCPGSVGLGPLQALCYDLPVITIDSPVHGPEIEYLESRNSLILPASTTPNEYAQKISDIFANNIKYQQLRSGIWTSIHHLTIEQMAKKFICGMDAILAQSS